MRRLRMSGMKMLSQPELNALLYRACAITVRPRGPSGTGGQHLYIAWFARGLLKIGITNSPENRMASLPSDARTRGIIDNTSEHPDPLAVVSMGGIRLERALIQALAREQVSGEYFRGPLSSAIAAALEAA